MKPSISPIAFALCLLASAPGAFASPNLSNAPSASLATAPAVQWETVDDNVLARQTGKYAGASMISGFVLSLFSQWQAPNGATAFAQGSLTVRANAANQLSTHVSTSANVTDGMGSWSVNPNARVSGGQNISIYGLSQVTQVAGDSNLGANSATIDFSPAGSAFAVTGPNSPTASASNANGSVKASAAFINGGLALLLQTPAGVASQNIAPGGAGSIAQSLQIAGNAQTVVNQLALQVQTQPLSSASIRQLGAMQALQNMVMRR